MAKVRANTTATNDPVINSGAGQDTLQTGFGKFNAHFHDYDSAHMTNKTGAQVVAGDVVAISDSDASAFELDNTASSLRRFVVVAETINVNATGEVIRSGVVSVKCSIGVAVGEYVRKSGTTKVLSGINQTVASGLPAPPGSLGVAVSGVSGGMATIDFWGVPVTGMLFDELKGLALSNNATDPTNDIDITSGLAVSDDDSVYARIAMQSISGMTKQLDAAFAAGTNQGMRDSSDNLTGAKTFHVYAIANTAVGLTGGNDGNAEFFASTSLSPTLPTGYTKKRRIGSIPWSGSTIRGFVQDGDYFRLKASVLDVDVTNPGTNAVLRTLTVPSGINVFALINGGGARGTGNNGRFYFSDPAADDEQASVSAAPLMSIQTGALGVTVVGAAQMSVRTDTSARIRTRVSESGGDTTMRIATLGWTDRRGKG